MLLGSIMKLFVLPFRGTRKYLLCRILFLLKRNRRTFRTGRQENIKSLVKTEVLQGLSMNELSIRLWSQCSYDYSIV